MPPTVNAAEARARFFHRGLVAKRGQSGGETGAKRGDAEAAESRGEGKFNTTWGHSSKAVHRYYEKRVLMKIPSLD
jgi:hypothetical protein